MAVNRVLYATQTVRLQTNSIWYALPAQTASADETIPQDDVLVLGKLGGVARLQKDVATCKASVKIFALSDLTMLTNTVSYTEGTVHNMAQMCTALEAQSRLGVNARIQVDSAGLAGTTNQDDGFQIDAICSSISVDAGKGAFPTLDFSFEGVGRLDTLAMGTAGTLADTNGGDTAITSGVPLTSQNVDANGATNDTVASLKFSYDMPTEVLNALGGQIKGTTSQVSATNKMFTKPPFKASMTADGQGLTNIAAAWASAAYMDLESTTGNNSCRFTIVSTGLAVSSQSFSQNVGDVGATFNVTAEGTDATFTV